MDLFHLRKIREEKKRRTNTSMQKDKNSIASSHQFSSVQKYLGAESITHHPLKTVPPIPKPSTLYNRQKNKSGIAKGINEHFLFLRK